MAKTEDVKIKTRATKDMPARQIIVQYTFAESLEEATQMYGEALCKSLINKAVKVGAQAAGRPLLAENKSLEEIQAAVSNYRPEEGSRRGRVKYIADMGALKEQFSAMPADQKAAMLAMFEAYLAGEEVPVPANGDDEDDDESGDEDEDEDDSPSETGSPPSNANRVGRRPRGPQYD